MRTLNIPVNETGRDFVCGDLHGSYDRLESFMDAVNFNVHTDRMFSVGDLVDRGPHSERCLALVLQPWFFSVYANHEELMCDFYNDGPLGFAWVRNGGDWGLKYLEGPTAEDLQDTAAWLKSLLENEVSKLPHLMTVNMQNGKKFHVIHAELPCQVGITDDVIADPTFAERHLMKKDPFEGTINLLWQRKLFGMLAKQNVDDYLKRKILRATMLNNMHLVFSDKLSHIYSGHTILQRPTTLYGQTNLDTGAYLSYYGDRSPPWAGLTVTEPLTGKYWLVTAAECREVEPLVIT